MVSRNKGCVCLAGCEGVCAVRVHVCICVHAHAYICFPACACCRLSATSVSVSAASTVIRDMSVHTTPTEGLHCCHAGALGEGLQHSNTEGNTTESTAVQLNPKLECGVGAHVSHRLAPVMCSSPPPACLCCFLRTRTLLVAAPSCLCSAGGLGENSCKCGQWGPW